VWLGFVMGGFPLVETPIQLAINHSAGGVTGPIDVLISLVWVGAVALVLLIKPIWGVRPGLRCRLLRQSERHRPHRD